MKLRLEWIRKREREMLVEMVYEIFNDGNISGFITYEQ